MTPAERLDLRDLILECLAVHETRKVKIRAKQSKALHAELVATAPVEPGPIYQLSTVWLDCIGAVNVGRLGKAFKPLLATYDPKWIEVGIRSYAAEIQRTGSIRFASPEAFASRATGYILPAMPSNELTEYEAALIGMTESRDHAATLGLLTDRARG